ncbi:nucleoside-diphosphate kinase [Candidatus Peregrinibacteria bacterium]|nr:nucleoside-diphosphate kinase [Candidatus Peregrinibacteria bacterium]
MEKTLVLIKPDGVQRRLIGEIVGRVEKKGLKLAALKLFSVTEKQARELYSIHKGKPFYEGLVKFITQSPIVAMVIEGFSAITAVRKLLGATYGFQAEPGTIRGDFGLSKAMNLVHGSDSPESAAREIPIFFSKEELLSYDICDKDWVSKAKED